MFFESLAGLWFALSLPAIIVMYLFKRKYIDTPVSSHLLWSRVLKDIEANRPWQKLRNRLLMLIQLLAAALLVLALMKPFVWSEQETRDHVVLVVDNSASMQSLIRKPSQEGGPYTRLQEAKDRIREWAKQEARGSRFTVISVGGVPEVRLSSDDSFAALDQALAGIDPFYGTAAYEEALSLAAALTREDPEAEIRLVTDGQWPESAAAVRLDVPWTVDQPTRLDTDNIQVVQFGVREDGTGQRTVTAVATVKNWGAQEAVFDVSLYAADRLAETKQLQLAAGEQRTVYFQGLPSADYYRLDAEADDVLQEDNTAYAFLSGGRHLTAVLAGEGNLFLEKALSLAGVDLLKVQRSGATFAIPESPFDFVVVDAVENSAIAGAEWQELLADKPVWYVRTGLEGAETAVGVNDYSVADHPVTQYISLLDTHIASALAGEPPVWAKPIITAGQLPLVYAGEENGQERLLFAFDLHDSDLPLRSEFPILVQNAVEWLGKSRTSSLGLAAASETREIPVSLKAARAQWIAADGGQGWDADIVDGRVSSLQTVPPVPGLYRFVEWDENGTELQSRWLASVMDSRESNLAMQHGLTFGSGSQEEAGPKESGADAGESPAVRQAEGKAPVPVTSWLIVLVIIVVLLEWGVYQRGNSV